MTVVMHRAATSSSRLEHDRTTAYTSSGLSNLRPPPSFLWLTGPVEKSIDGWHRTRRREYEAHVMSIWSVRAGNARIYHFHYYITRCVVRNICVSVEHCRRSPFPERVDRTKRTPREHDYCSAFYVFFLFLFLFLSLISDYWPLNEPFDSANRPD